MPGLHALAVLVALAAVPAFGGSYVSGGLAMVHAPDQHLNGAAAERRLDFDLGFRAAQISVGRRLGNHWLAELSAVYYRNELELVQGGNPALINTRLSDDLAASGGLLTLLREFRLNPRFDPYLGIGLGYLRSDYTIGDVRRGGELLSDRAGALAGQAIAGVSAWLSPRWQLSADYRYLHTARMTLTGADDSRYRVRNRLHLIALQARYHRRARSIAALPPAPAAGGRYLVLRFGVAAAEDSDLEDGLIDTNFDAFDAGGQIALALGTHLPRRPHWRLELEGLALRNHADVVDFGELAGEFPLRGAVNVRALMFNLSRDIGRARRLQPSFGLGLGAARFDYAVDRGDAPFAEFARGQDYGAAGQALLGVRAPLGRFWSASLQYRYFWAPWVRLTRSDGTRLGTEHSAHGLALSIGRRLGRSRLPPGA